MNFLLLPLHSFTLLVPRVVGFVHPLLLPDTSIKQELDLFVQGSVFAFGKDG